MTQEKRVWSRIRNLYRGKGARTDVSHCGQLQGRELVCSELTGKKKWWTRQPLIGPQTLYKADMEAMKEIVQVCGLSKGHPMLL